LKAQRDSGPAALAGAVGGDHRTGQPRVETGRLSMVPGAVTAPGAIARAKARLAMWGRRSGRRKGGLQAQRAERSEPQRNGDGPRVPRSRSLSTAQRAGDSGAERPNDAGQSQHELHDERERPAETANHSWFSNWSDRVTTQESPAGFPTGLHCPPRQSRRPWETSQLPANIKLTLSVRFAEPNGFRRSDQQSFILSGLAETSTKAIF
jgi:hypothetical protein